ncbi:unnamed protein product [Discula destructiva]
MGFPRPSTSGGLGRRGGNTNVDKRMSKDDSFLYSRRTGMASNNRISRDDFYITERLAATHSPPPPASLDWPPARKLNTPESMTSGDIPIGMALGSPVLPPPDVSRWQARFPPASPQSTDVSSASSPAMNGPNGSLQRKKTGRRKLFGLFGGGKKHAGEEDNRGGLAHFTKGGPGASTSALTSTMSPVPKTPKTPTRSMTQSSGKMPKHKPLLMRSSTMPYNMEDEQSAASTHGAMPRATDPFQRHANENQARAMSPNPSVPRLDVRIPDTKMERYSVMFSDVLNDSNRQANALSPFSQRPVISSDKEPAASLLARRQATLERLKTINGSNGGFLLEPVIEDDRARPRRATSPQSHGFPQLEPATTAAPAYSSPRLSVFPMPPSGRPSINASTPTTQPRFARSNTSPGRLPSPTHGVFDRRPKASTAKSNRNLETPGQLEMSPPDSSRPGSRKQEPIYPTDTSFRFGQEQSGLILDSPTSIGSHEEIIISQPFKPTLHEPQWQMISSPATTNASSMTTTASSVGRRGRSPSAASCSTHTTKPSSELDETDAALQNAVEVSIARQISISRQQRNLLRPLNTRQPAETTRSAVPNGVASRAMRGDGRSPLGMKIVKAPSPGRLGSDEPIKETKSSTPTLVHSRGSPVDPQNRKSSWVVLESD